MQQIGAALGLAVLVTVFGSASRHAAETTPVGDGTPLERAHHVFVSGAQSAFLTATVLLVATLLVVLAAVGRRPRRAVQVEVEAA